jgi:septum formation protein
VEHGTVIKYWRGGDNVKIYLASRSPQRKRLLETLGISFEVISPRFEEKPTDRPAAEESLYFAEEKARSVAPLCPESLIIGSDTLIDCEGQKIGKPAGDGDAYDILRKLSGREHRLYTAVVLLNTKEQTLKSHLEEVRVVFRPLSEKEIRDYIATGEPIGKAGGYAVQGEGRKLIREIDGDENAVVGLPLGPLKKWLLADG